MCVLTVGLLTLENKLSTADKYYSIVHDTILCSPPESLIVRQYSGGGVCSLAPLGHPVVGDE